MQLVFPRSVSCLLFTLFFLFLCFYPSESIIRPSKMLSTPEIIKKSSDFMAKIPLLISPRAGFMNGFVDSDEDEEDEVIEIFGCPNVVLNGAYTKAEEEVNGYPHYERIHSVAGKTEVFHLYWSGNQWIIHKVRFTMSKPSHSSRASFFVIGLGPCHECR